MDYVKENSKIWDTRAENNDAWSIPVSSEMIQLAKKGIWSIVLTPNKTVPLDWFPDEINSKKYYVWQAVVDSKDLLWQH